MSTVPASHSPDPSLICREQGFEAPRRLWPTLLAPSPATPCRESGVRKPSTFELTIIFELASPRASITRRVFGSSALGLPYLRPPYLLVGFRAVPFGHSTPHQFGPGLLGPYGSVSERFGSCYPSPSLQPLLLGGKLARVSGPARGGRYRKEQACAHPNRPPLAP